MLKKTVNIYFLLLITIILMFAFLICSCAPGDDKNPAREKRDNTLIFASHNTSGVFNPCLVETGYDGWIIELIFDPLLSVESDGQLSTNNRALAEEVEFDKEELTYTYYLKDGVKFHDGEKLTSEDVRFTWKTLAHPEYDGRLGGNVSNIKGAEEFRAGKTDEIEGINIIDDHTIEVQIIEPLATQKHELNMRIIPKHYYEWENYQEDFVDLNHEPIGTGPFQMDKYLPDQRVKLTSHEAYYLGRPEIDNLIYEIVSDDTRIPELKTGTVDIIDFTETPENVSLMEDIEHSYIVDYMNNGFSYIAVHHEDPFLGEQKVRQALMYGLDRNSWIDSFFEGLASPAHASISPASWAYPGDEAFEQYEYDPDYANQLLDKAGYDNWDEDGKWRLNNEGKPVEITYKTYYDADWSQDLPVLARDNWEDLGIKLEIEVSEFTSLQQEVMREQDFQMFNMAWNLTADPDPYDLFSKTRTDPGENNFGQYHNEEVEKLMEKGRKDFDQEKREEIYEKLFVKLNKELPVLFVYTREENFGVNDRVNNFKPNEFQQWTWNAHEISVDY